MGYDFSLFVLFVLLTDCCYCRSLESVVHKTQNLNVKHASMFLSDDLLGLSVADHNDRFVNDPKFIDEINSKQSLWVAAAYPEMEQATIGQVHTALQSKGSSHLCTA